MSSFSLFTHSGIFDAKVKDTAFLFSFGTKVVVRRSEGDNLPKG